MLECKARLLAVVLALTTRGAFAQGAAEEPPPPPPPSAPAPAPEAHAADAPWGLPKDTLDALARQADVYRDYAVRFVCVESARVAHYDESAEATSEKSRRYSYLLERPAEGVDIRELRQVLKKQPKKKKDEEAEVESHGQEANDEERFPPAYAWVFLFSTFEQPYFMYRMLGDRFEGFDWVHEIEFRGALPFTDGKDIREWEGTALVDAVTLTPIEIRAEPTAQKDRIRALFDRWQQAFSLVGAHLAPRPFGYRCRVGFGMKKDRLTFPTELRYDTFRAIGPKNFIPWMASVRAYSEYKFFKTTTTESPVEPIRP